MSDITRSASATLADARRDLRIIRTREGLRRDGESAPEHLRESRNEWQNYCHVVRNGADKLLILRQEIARVNGFFKIAELV